MLDYGSETISSESYALPPPDGACGHNPKCTSCTLPLNADEGADLRRSLPNAKRFSNAVRPSRRRLMVCSPDNDLADIARTWSTRSTRSALANHPYCGGQRDRRSGNRLLRSKPVGYDRCIISCQRPNRIITGRIEHRKLNRSVARSLIEGFVAAGLGHTAL